MARRPRQGPDGRDVADAALWQRVTETVAPLPGRPRSPVLAMPAAPGPAAKTRAVTMRLEVPMPRPGPAERGANTLDGTWDRKLARGGIVPERSVDLHGETMDRAYGLIDAALEAAVRGGERVVLLVTGKVRPDVRPGVRGTRGAIRAVVHDWLAHSRHAGAIAAIRPAHPRHGGAGALYVVMRRR